MAEGLDTLDGLFRSSNAVSSAARHNTVSLTSPNDVDTSSSGSSLSLGHGQNNEDQFTEHEPLDMSSTDLVSARTIPLEDRGVERGLDMASPVTSEGDSDSSPGALASAPVHETTGLNDVPQVYPPEVGSLDKDLPVGRSIQDNAALISDLPRCSQEDPEILGGGLWEAGVVELDESMHNAARRIQTSFRGYNVRRRQPLKHLRKIAIVRRKLSELQAKAEDPAYIEKICVDVMECRKLTEGIMALLLQLDALQGVHPVVRDIRKSVNREVVQFMEVIDAVVVGAVSSPWQDCRNAPNIMRSHSSSRMDRSSSYPLRRMYSLGNCAIPEQSYQLQGGKMLTVEQEGGKRGSNEEARRTKDSLPAVCARRDGNPNNELQGKCVGNSGHSAETSVSEADLTGVDLSSAALLIQSRFRGYMVRRSRPLKHLRTIAVVRLKLRQLSSQVSSPVLSAKLRFDNMERLKLTEIITALLLQLDSVQGVDQVIRDIRKSVTLEVFKLQEVVDELIYGAGNSMSSRLNVGSNEAREEQPSLEDSIGGMSSTTEDCYENGILFVVKEIDGKSQGDQRREFSVNDISANEQPSDFEHPNMSNPESEENEVGLVTCGCHMEPIHVGVDPKTECSSPRSELDNVQVRPLDVTMQNRETSYTATESAEHQVNDRQSGLCAAVLGRYTSRDEESAIRATLNSDLSALEEVLAQEVPSRDIRSKLDNHLWLDRFLDVVHGKERTYFPWDRMAVEDLQAGALSGNARSHLLGLYMSFVSQDSNLGSIGEQLCLHGPEQKIETRNSEGLHATSRAASMESLCDDRRAPGSIDSEPSSPECKFISNIPGGLASTPSELIPVCNIASQNEDNHIMLLEREDECCRCSGMQFFDKLPLQTMVGKKRYQEREPTSSLGEVGHVVKSSSSSQPCLECSVRAENEKQYKACPLLTKKQGLYVILPLNVSRANNETSACICTPESSATISENSKPQDICNVEYIRQLVEENNRLKALLNEVIIVAQMQSKRSPVKVRLDVWRKKPKTVKRRKRSEG